MRLKLSAAVLVFVFLASMGAAEYSIKDQDQPQSQDLVSNYSQTVQLARLVDSSNNNDPVTQSELDSSGWDSFSWIYNSSSSSQEKSGEMAYLTDGYYYANFTANVTQGFIEYELTSSTAEENNQTEAIDQGNLTVSILTDLSGNFTVDHQFDFKVNVTDEWNDTWVSEKHMRADIYLTNGSWTSEIISLGNHVDNEYHKNFDVSFPLKPGGTYAVHANATAQESELGTSNLNGSESRILHTYPAIKGKIDYLNSTSGCNNESFFNDCERGASVETGFNVTSATANTVNFTVKLVEKSSGDWHTKESTELTQSDGLYTGSLNLPDVNTSKYEKKYVLRYNVSNKERTYLETYNVSYSSFSIDDDSASNAYQGSSYDVKTVFEKPFSFESLNDTRFQNASIDVKYPDGSILTEFNLSDMTYKQVSGFFKKSIDIPSDATTDGSYEISVEAFNIYGEKKTLDAGFNVKNVTQTFNTSGDFTLYINGTGIHEQNVTLWNKMSSEREISTSFSGDLDGMTDVNDSNSIILPADGKVQAEVDFNITYVEDLSGGITFNDSAGNYENSIDVDLEAPFCQTRDNELCLQQDGWLNVTQQDYSGVTREVDIRYLGDRNGSVTIQTSLTGDISDYLTVEDSFDLEGKRTLTLDYNATENGTYTGNVSFEGGGDEVSFKTGLESNAGVSSSQQQVTETGLEAPETLDLGSYSSGETVIKTVRLNNTGDAEITDISVESATLNVFGDLSSIDAGSSKTATITFQSLSSESGTVEIVGNSAGETVSATIEVSGTVETTGSTGTGTQPGQQTPSTGAAQNPGQNQGSGGSSILPLAAGLFILLVVGFVAYTSIEMEEGDPLYGLLGE